MAPETLQRKLEHLGHFLLDLEKHRGCSYESYWEHHYEVDRLLELCGMVAIDIIFHLLAARKEETPGTYASGFYRAGEIGLLPQDLAKSLAQAAGLRNILAHGYAIVDPRKVHAGIDQAVKDFSRFIAVLKRG